MSELSFLQDQMEHYVIESKELRAQVELLRKNNRNLTLSMFRVEENFTRTREQLLKTRKELKEAREEHASCVLERESVWVGPQEHDE